MNTQELKCFLRVAERMNFTRAAEELYLTPPTVTHHIQKLEEALGVKLFRRDSKSVRLTIEGEAFYQDARDIMMRIEVAYSHLNNIKESKHTLLRIGCITAEETDYLSEPLSKLREMHPSVEPRIIISDFSRHLKMLKDDNLDIILGTRDMISDKEDFIFTPLYTCLTNAIFNDDFSVSSNNDEVSLHDIENFPIVALYSKNIPLQPNDAIDKFLTTSQKPLQIIRQEDASAVIALASSGYGVGILPEYAISKYTKTTLHHLKIKEGPSIEYGLIHLSGSKNPYIKEFSKILSKFSNK